MDEASLTDLAALIADRLCGTYERVCVVLIRHLAAGQPVSPAHLAETLTMEEPAVGAVLRQLSDVDYDGAGNVVGFGLSLMPTAHQFIINGQILYTWCALDTFIHISSK
jgi:alkylmercury lyase